MFVIKALRLKMKHEGRYMNKSSCRDYCEWDISSKAKFFSSMEEAEQFIKVFRKDWSEDLGMVAMYLHPLN